ncbi:MAG: hypothetical protein KGJ98_14735 [Chloroflexota bacterium]|nr:hypothetical protein [Chloroflexota bacterium]
MTTPAGKTPVVLTFDDSDRSQFQFIAGPDGKLTVDPTSGLGILEAVQQIALGQKWIDDLVPGYPVTIFDPPHGAYPRDESLIVSGTYQGTTYHNLAALEVGAEPMTAPDDRATDFLHTARIQAIPSQLDLWLSYLERRPEERYVSDGDPDRLVFPASLAKEYRPRAGASELTSPDPAYELVRLRG